MNRMGNFENKFWACTLEVIMEYKYLLRSTGRGTKPSSGLKPSKWDHNLVGGSDFRSRFNSLVSRAFLHHRPRGEKQAKPRSEHVSMTTMFFVQLTLRNNVKYVLWFNNVILFTERCWKRKRIGHQYIHLVVNSQCVRIFVNSWRWFIIYFCDP